jgi:hypothetical protein
MANRVTNGVGVVWTVGANWVGGVAPVNGVDTGTVKAGHTMLEVPAGATCLNIEANGVVATNTGTVTANNGYVVVNNGTVTTNAGIVSYSIGTIAANNGDVIANTGTVTANTSNVFFNAGTITTNSGTITYDVTAMIAAVNADLGKVRTTATAIAAAFGVTPTLTPAGSLGPFPVGLTSIGPFPVNANSVGPYPVTAP